MNHSTDPLFDRRIAAWLEEDPNRAPDQALATVLAAVPSIAQRRRLPVPWRYTTMSLPLRIAAATVLAAVVVGGGIYLLGPKAAGPGTDTSPSPTASPPASPSPTPPPPALTDGLLEPGRYSYDGTNVRVILTVPAGWEGGAFSLSHAPGRELPDGANLGIRQPTIGFGDPCAPETSARNIGLTVADFVSEMSSLPNVTDFAQEDVTMSGFSGVHVSFVVDTEGIDCVMGLYRQLDFIRAADNGQREDMWILDIEGTRLVIDAATYPETSAAVRAELQAVVDTLVIEPLD